MLVYHHPAACLEVNKGRGVGGGRGQGRVPRNKTSDREEQLNKFEEKKNHFLIVFL